MVRCFALVAVIACALNAFATGVPEAAPPESANMRSIFNGKDLTGWSGDPRLWSVKDGAIRGETTAEKSANGKSAKSRPAAGLGSGRGVLRRLRLKHSPLARGLFVSLLLRGRHGVRASHQARCGATSPLVVAGPDPQQTENQSYLDITFHHGRRRRQTGLKSSKDSADRDRVRGLVNGGGELLQVRTSGGPIRIRER